MELYEYHRKKLRWFRQNIFDLYDAGRGRWGTFMLLYHRDQMMKHDPTNEQRRYNAEEREVYRRNSSIVPLDYM